MKGENGLTSKWTHANTLWQQVSPIREGVSVFLKNDIKNVRVQTKYGFRYMSKIWVIQRHNQKYNNKTQKN